ncbi:MAG TPA: hypothetical protein VMT55_01675, partial [Candidatus Sulfotelmatobacter sp.]|nr:hypothetical protein [Candidatus Sulfotelmatobacter sp.]
LDDRRLCLYLRLFERMAPTLKNFIKGCYETIVFYLHGNDEKKAKRVTALVLIGILAPAAVPAYVKTGYSWYYAWKNNLPPSTMAVITTKPVPPAKETHDRHF